MLTSAKRLHAMRAFMKTRVAMLHTEPGDIPVQLGRATFGRSQLKWRGWEAAGQLLPCPGGV